MTKFNSLQAIKILSTKMDMQKDSSLPYTTSDKIKNFHRSTEHLNAKQKGKHFMRTFAK